MKRIEKRYRLKKSIKIFIYKCLYTIIILLIGMIICKKNPELKSIIHKNIYENSFNFIKIKSFYEKYFGNNLSVNKINKKEQSVFNELSYNKINKYKNGAKLELKNNIVPIIESGVIIYINDNTYVVEQVNGINTTYSNIINSNYKIYDYIDKGDILGEVNNNILYINFQKEGEYLDYKKYI